MPEKSDVVASATKRIVRALKAHDRPALATQLDKFGEKSIGNKASSPRNADKKAEGDKSPHEKESSVMEEELKAAGDKESLTKVESLQKLSVSRKIEKPIEALANSLLANSEFHSAVEEYWKWKESGEQEDPFCEWIFNWLTSENHFLMKCAVSTLPSIIFAYGIRIANKTSLLGAEAVLLAAYKTLYNLRGGKELAFQIPSLSQPSILHDGIKTRDGTDEGLKIFVEEPPLKDITVLSPSDKSLIIKAALQLYSEFCPLFAKSNHEVLIRVSSRLAATGYPFDPIKDTRGLQLWTHSPDTTAPNTGGTVPASNGQAQPSGETSVITTHPSSTLLVPNGTEAPSATDSSNLKTEESSTQVEGLSGANEKEQVIQVSSSNASGEVPAIASEESRVSRKSSVRYSYFLRRIPIQMDIKGWLRLIHCLGQCAQHASQKRNAISALKLIQLRARMDLTAEIILASDCVIKSLSM